MLEVIIIFIWTEEYKKEWNNICKKLKELEKQGRVDLSLIGFTWKVGDRSVKEN